MFNAKKADNFINAAMRFKGQWYKWGGGHGGEMKRPGGVDCSGLVMQAGYKADINLVGTASMQQDKGRAVSMRHLKPGDLVFSGNPAYHVGIYVGKGKVLHAPRTGKRVGITSVGQFQNARRIFKGLGDQAQQRLNDLNARFKRADANRNGRVEGAELKQADGLRRFDRQGAIDWKTVKNAFTKANSY